MRQVARHSERGSVALEFALLQPVFLMMILAVVEFGIYFLKYEVVANAVNTMANEIQSNPIYPAGGTSANGVTQAGEQADSQKSGGTLVDFSKPNWNTPYICAYAYASPDQALIHQCDFESAFIWNTQGATASPTAVPPGTPYYVYIQAYVPNKNITPLGAFWAGALGLTMKVSKVIQVGATAVTPSSTATNITGGCMIGSSYWTSSTTEFACGSSDWCISDIWGKGCLALATKFGNIGNGNPFIYCTSAADTTNGYTCGLSGMDGPNSVAFCTCVK